MAGIQNLLGQSLKEIEHHGGWAVWSICHWCGRSAVLISAKLQTFLCHFYFLVSSSWEWANVVITLRFNWLKNNLLQVSSAINYKKIVLYAWLPIFEISGSYAISKVGNYCRRSTNQPLSETDVARINWSYDLLTSYNLLRNSTTNSATYRNSTSLQV